MRPWTKRRPTGLALVLMIGLLLAACAGGAAQEEGATEEAAAEEAATEEAAGEAATEAGDDEVTPLAISATGVDSLPFMAILQVAIDKGWFEEAGLDASLFSGGGGGDTVRVVSTGDADLAIAGNTAVYLAAQQPGSNLDVIGAWFQVNDFYWITPDPEAEFEGATLGFSRAGSTTELIIKAMQAARPEANIQAVQVGGMGETWAAARSGNITAGWAMHPFVTDKQQNEGAHILVASRDIIGDHPADLVAVNSEYAAQNPEAVTAFFEVADRAMRYVVEDTEAAAADLASVLALEPELVQQGLEETPELEKAYSLTVDPESLSNLSDLMQAADQIQEPVDWSQVLDQQYLPESARAEL